METLGTGKPHLIIMVGIPGSGKSFFADHFAETFKSPIISYDKILSEIHSEGQEINGQIEAAALGIAEYMLAESMKTKRTIIFDGPTDQRIIRDQLVKRAKLNDYDPLLVWVQTEPITAKKRATKKENPPFITAERFDEKCKKFNQPGRFEKTIVISGKHTYPSQLKIVLKSLAGPKIIEKPANRRIIIS